jgi:hypothetical protein
MKITTQRQTIKIDSHRSRRPLNFDSPAERDRTISYRKSYHYELAAPYVALLRNRIEAAGVVGFIEPRQTEEGTELRINPGYAWEYGTGRAMSASLIADALRQLGQPKRIIGQEFRNALVRDGFARITSWVLWVGSRTQERWHSHEVRLWKPR